MPALRMVRPGRHIAGVSLCLLHRSRRFTALCAIPFSGLPHGIVISAQPACRGDARCALQKLLPFISKGMYFMVIGASFRKTES